jgi:hypothetical protein
MLVSTIAIISLFLVILGIILLLIGILKKIKLLWIIAIASLAVGIIIYVLGFTIKM